MEQEESTKILVDNQATIAISHNLVFHGKTKHFNIKLFFLREVQKDGDVIFSIAKQKNRLQMFSQSHCRSTNLSF